MPSHPRTGVAITIALAVALILGVASADTPSAADLPTSMTNDDVGFTISYPPSWAVTTYTGANQIDFNDGLTFVIFDAFDLDILPVREPAALLELVVEDIQFFLTNLAMTELPTQAVGGLEAIGVSYTGTEDDLDVRGAILVMADERYAYLINFEEPAELYASYEPTFWAMVASFARHRADRATGRSPQRARRQPELGGSRPRASADAPRNAPSACEALTPTPLLPTQDPARTAITA